MNEEEFSELLQSHENPRDNILFKQFALNKLAKCSFNQKLLFFIHYKIDFETFSSMILFQDKPDNSLLSVDKFFSELQQFLMNNEKTSISPQVLMYAHYLYLNFTCLTFISVSPIPSIQYLTEHQNDGTLPFLEPELNTLLQFMELPDVSAQKANGESQDQENGFEQLQLPQFEVLTNMNRIVNQRCYDNQKFELLIHLITQQPGNSNDILRLIDELTKNFRTFTPLAKYFISDLNNIEIFTKYFMSAISLTPPGYEELIYVRFYEEAKASIMKGTPPFDKIPNNSNDAQSVLEQLLTVAGDETLDPKYYILAAYLSEGDNSIQHYIDAISFCFYRDPLISLDDVQAKIGIDIFSRTQYSCYIPFFLQFIPKEELYTNLQPKIMKMGSSKYVQSLPYIEDIKMFYTLWDDLEEINPLFRDPRNDRVVRQLIATQFKRKENQKNLKIQCIYSFFNDISKKVNKCSRLLFPPNKD